jgi:hypothetical protein
MIKKQGEAPKQWNNRNSINRMHNDKT